LDGPRLTAGGHRDHRGRRDKEWNNSQSMLPPVSIVGLSCLILFDFLLGVLCDLCGSRTVWHRLDFPRTNFYNAQSSQSRCDLLGAVAQLGERCVRNAEVEGSTPFRSTSLTPIVTRWRWVFLFIGSESARRHACPTAGIGMLVNRDS